MDLKHALITLLLLVGLLSIQGARRRYVPWVVLAGVGLALWTPIRVFESVWPVLYALVLPPLLWTFIFCLLPGLGLYPRRRN